MANRFEKTEAGVDIVIDGFEKGIANSPYEGIADMRNMNIMSSPKQASVNFQTALMTTPPVVNALAFTVEVTDIFTVSSTSGWYAGMAIQLNSLAGGTGLATGVVYYVGSIVGNTFKVYGDYATGGTAVNVTLAGSGTLTSFQFGDKRGLGTFINFPELNWTTDPSTGYVYVADRSNYVWFLISTGSALGANVQSNTLYFMGNIGGGAAAVIGGNGVVFWKSYLFLFWFNGIDYVKPGSLIGSTPAAQWVYNWKSIVRIGNIPSISATDDAVYFGLGNALGSLLENPGTTFAPGTSSTYTFNTEALLLPNGDEVISIAQLGINLLIGGKQTFIYPWDRVSTSFNYPLVVAESNIRKIVATNSSAYVFAGNRGRIYITNGANIDLWKKIPDYLSGVLNPYYYWMDAIYLRNQLYFAFFAEQNDGTNLNNTAGVWAIDLDSEALRMNTELSYATFAGNVVFIAPQLADRTPAGDALFAGWTTPTLFSSTYGVDISVGTPYQASQAYIDIELIPIGTFLTKKTFQNVEWKLARPLVNGESISIYYRVNLTDSFTLLETTTTAGFLSDQPYPVTFEMGQWLQLRVVTSSTSSSPSYVPLRELRLR